MKLNSVQPSKLSEKMIQFHKDVECHLSKLHLLEKKVSIAVQKSKGTLKQFWSWFK